ncbi:MAG: hypothetical protein ACTSPY_14660 [Candidatus Helarchaeota archaeon]
MKFILIKGELNIIDDSLNKYKWIDSIKKTLKRDESQVIKYKDLRTYDYLDNAVNLIKELLMTIKYNWIRISTLQNMIVQKYKIKIGQTSIKGLIKKVIQDKSYKIFPKQKNDEFPNEVWISYKGKFQKSNYRCGVCFSELSEIFQITEQSQEIIRAECPNCNTYLKLKYFDRNIIPFDITECQYCKEKNPIYLICPTCGLYLCKKCVIYHEKILHLNSEIPKNVHCERCKSIYIELKCEICDKWYCKNCFPKSRKYTEFWYVDEYIDNPLNINEDSIKDFLNNICIKCINYFFNCDKCENKNNPKFCKVCILESRVRIYELAIKKIQKELKSLKS